jgi:septal ring factor EnvC (AmiA/AmiB activator)
VSAITDLLAQYSFESLLLTVLGLAVGIKYCAELIDWFYTKVKKFFNSQSEKQTDAEKTLDKLNTIADSLETVDGKLDNLNNKVQKLERDSEITTDRLQEQARSFIIDKHHYFCYEVEAIDDINLQSLERQYLYYVKAGGDSFIENLMAEVRALPKISLSTAQQARKLKSMNWGDNENGTRAKSIND